MKKFFLTLTTLLTLFIGLFFITTHASATTTVKIASDNAYAPFEFQDSNKKWVGIDVDIIKEVAKENHWKLDLTFPGFDTAVNQLKAGQVDGVIAGMSITDERKKVFDFSDPYYTSALTIATTKEHKITSYAKLKGKTVGAKNGTAAQAWLQANQSKYGYTIKTYADGTHMYSALSAGNIAGAMDDVPVIAYAIAQGQDLATNLPKIVEPGGYGFAVVKGTHSKLINEFNKTYTKMKENGDYQKIIDKYTSSSNTATSTNLNAKAKPKKAVYQIYSDNSFAPFEFQNSNKQFTGIDVDLLNAIAKEQGFKIHFNFVGFAAALNGLSSGQADGMMSGMSITDERKKTFTFSNSYYNSNITVAVNKATSDISKWSDLSGKVVGAKNGTASYDYLIQNKSKYGYSVKTFSDATSMYSALKTGSINAVMDDEPVIQYAIKQGQKFKIPLKSIPEGSYGFAVKKGSNPELIQMFNYGLAKLKSDGQYDKIIGKYLATSEEKTSKKTINENSFLGIIVNNWQQILSGLKITLLLALVGFVLALVVGILFGLMSVSPNKIFRGIARVYIDLNRSIPLLVLIFFLFYGIPNLLQIITGQQHPLNEFLAGVIALTLNESAYISETIRGGVQAVPIGQMEASRSLGVPYTKTMRKVIIPQVIKITIPSLINQFVITVKDTTLVATIGLVEMFQVGQIIVARNFQGFTVYGLIGLIYIIILLSLMWLGRYVERKLK
ncbi:ABC transporter substrate-binding protein/permease [Lactococcus nasutitermitis]|uniref:ABC transporter substrate-binding protein/permease n=1 Tax=Lactococcus nasutitermitis TaxID=1652957 RepID=A0ABV9JBE7_9LACT|nr:ABC transporter substrate-binding protein/permease [Lactococcus nasutitermitis]